MPSYRDYSVEAYGSMIRDRGRTGPFVEALQQAIQPGSVVLDIGTGTGIFAFLACRYGAARVYAVEPDPAIEVARRSAGAIPGADRITWIQGLSTDIELPEQVDVVVGDLHGVLPFFKGNLESMADARKRHLKPGGRMIPERDVLYAVPAFAPEEYARASEPWLANDYGLDLSAGAPHVINQWRCARSEPALPEHLLSQPQPWGEVNYGSAVPRAIEGSLSWVIERPGTMHGLYVWFDGELGGGIGFSNAPQLPELVYGRAFFPFERGVEVATGDRLDVALSVHKIKGKYIYRWTSRTISADGTTLARFDQSTFKSALLDLETLRKGGADYTPTLGVDGQVARAVLECLSEGQPLMAIARSVAAAFPAKFATAEQALVDVARLSQRYG